MQEDKQLNESVNEEEQIETGEDGAEESQETNGGSEENNQSRQKSVYEEELERIEQEKQAALERAEQAEKEANERARQNQIKDEALQKEKEKTKGVKDQWKMEVMSEWRREQALERAKERVSEITEDPAAQKLTLHHFERLPETLKTGNVQEDLLTAFALANRKRLPSLVSQESMNDAQDRRSIASMGGSSSSSSFQARPSQAEAMAARLSQMYAGNNKDLAKRLQEKNRQRLGS